MLSGLKFIPRDQIDTAPDGNLDDFVKERKTSSIRKEKDRRKKKSHYSSSDEDLERIRKGSRKKKKWYSSNEDLSSSSDESESKSGSGRDQKKHSSRKRENKKYEDGLGVEERGRSKKKSRRRKDNSSDSESENDDGYSRTGKDKRKKGKKDANDEDIVRKEMGLEWMLKPKDDFERKSTIISDHQPEEALTEEVMKINPRELNPYYKDNGSGYPEDEDGTKAGGDRLLSASVVGDGGASWRLKALKRAQEQAAREGRKLEEVVEDRWGSLGQLAVSVASRTAAPSRAHLHAINIRRRGAEEQTVTDNQNERDTEKDVSVRHPKMRVPKLHDSLTWGKRKSQHMSTKDADLISSAMSSINKFSNDGSFMHEVMGQQKDDSPASFGSSTKFERKVELVSSETEKPSEEAVRLALSVNQLAAKVMQLRMKGKHEEADNLLKEAEKIKAEHAAGDESSKSEDKGNTRRYIMHDTTTRQKKKEEDADMHLAQKIVQNKKYSISGQADDEYDYDEGPRRKSWKKGGNDNKPIEKNFFANRILTQQERCQFCFENPTRPRHLVVAIANFTYLMLPQWQPVVPGHCCILPMQHESATRTLDNNVLDEIRNFKKCLIMLFAKQEKDVIFLETVMGLAQQRRHCLVECIPLPQEIAKQAPVYFKKAIDEAEDEWSQHNAKKLIDTSEKGLRGSIPKNFPYFHVEFGLKKGFVHVIDDEKQFKSNFGLNVVRGMLQLPPEDMHRRRAHESMETQKQAVVSFARDWAPFDWTKQLD